jgi:hypothetical protein
MTTAAEAKIAEHQGRAEQLRQNAEKARELEGAIRSMRIDLERLERRRDAYAAFGKGKIEIPNRHKDEAWPHVELEPFRSRLTGDELATGQQAEIDYLAAEIAKLEAEVEELLDAR